MAGNNSIQFVRGPSSARSNHTETSLVGQPIFETDTNKLYVGDGETPVNELTAVKASTADNVESTINNKSINDIFEDDGVTAKEATHATGADTASNVTGQINGEAIASIFEDDGVTIKQATKATQDGNGNDIVSTYATKAVASQSVDGLMSASDKAKLDSIPTNWWDAVEQGFITPSIGETRTIKVKGTTCKIQCIGLNHDDLVSGGKARTTWQLVDCYTSDQINSSLFPTNQGGWKNCILRGKLNNNSSSVLNTIKDENDNDLSGRIKQVIKRTANGGGSNYTAIITTEDHLFLPSATEVYGATSTGMGGARNARAGEGNQYEFYANALIPEPVDGSGQFTPLKENSSKGTFYSSDLVNANYWINKLGNKMNSLEGNYYNYNATKTSVGGSSIINWWLRSPYYNNTTDFCQVLNTGILHSSHVKNTEGVSFCFCI